MYAINPPTIAKDLYSAPITDVAVHFRWTPPPWFRALTLT